MNLAIIQARMGSSRLPGKIMGKICGKEMLWHIINRLQYSHHIDDIVVATTTEESDNEVADFCNNYGYKIYRGSEEDVLDRFYQCATLYSGDIIIRITADDPFKDPQVIDKLMEVYIEGSYDYVSNTMQPTYPEGIDVEVVAYDALKRAWKEADKPSEREHVTPYIWKNVSIFKCLNVEYEKDLSDMRWTVDDKNDFLFASTVYNALYKEGSIFLMCDILEYLEKNKDVELINSGHIRNEGYLKSISKE